MGLIKEWFVGTSLAIHWLRLHTSRAGHSGCPSPEDLPKPGMGPRSPTLQADSFPSGPSRKPVNTGAGSPPLLQGVFLT